MKEHYPLLIAKAGLSAACLEMIAFLLTANLKIKVGTS